MFSKLERRRPMLRAMSLTPLLFQGCQSNFVLDGFDGLALLLEDPGDRRGLVGGDLTAAHRTHHLALRGPTSAGVLIGGSPSVTLRAALLTSLWPRICLPSQMSMVGLPA